MQAFVFAQSWSKFSRVSFMYLPFSLPQFFFSPFLSTSVLSLSFLGLDIFFSSVSSSLVYCSFLSKCCQIHLYFFLLSVVFPIL